MEKIAVYQNIVEQVLKKHSRLPSSQFPNIRDIVLKDQSHFIQLTFGWHNQEYLHQISLHIEVKMDGKVWIHENRTDILIDEELIMKGIKSQDIVAGMLEDSTSTDTINTKAA